MQFLKENKVTIGVIVAAIIGLYVYFAYFSSGNDPLLDSTDSGTNGAVTGELLAALSNLKTIRLDDAIFKDPVFISLSDFGVALPKQPVGRRNPFEPFRSVPKSSQPASSGSN